MTSNAGTGFSEAIVDLGLLEKDVPTLFSELGNFFCPEFMNRFDGIIEFKAQQG